MTARQCAVDVTVLQLSRFEGDRPQSCKRNDRPSFPGQKGSAQTECHAWGFCEGSGDGVGATQKGLAGVADDLADRVEHEKAQPFRAGIVDFLG